MTSTGIRRGGHVAALLVCTLVALAAWEAEARPVAPPPAPVSLHALSRACAAYTGNCNQSAACAAAIAKYREQVYKVADYCDCANAIGADLIQAYPNVSAAVTYISNCMPGCIYGQQCPFVGTLVAVLSNGGGRGAMKNAGLSGVAVVKLNLEKEEVCFDVTAPKLTGNYSAKGLEVTIKQGSPFEGGAIALSLSKATPGVLSGCMKPANFDVAKDIAYSPHEYYVEVAMKCLSVGALRGSLGTSAALMAVVSSQPCGPAAPSSPKPVKKGYVSLVLDTFRLCYKLGGIANNTAKDAALIRGDVCKNAAAAAAAASAAPAAIGTKNSTVVAPLFGGSTTISPAMAGCGTPAKLTILQILADPSSFFASLNVSDGAAASSPIHKLEGRLLSKVSLTTTVTAADVVVVPYRKTKKPKGTTGSSEAAVKVDLVIGEGYACYSFKPGKSFEQVTAAYLRAGKAKTVGDILAVLFRDVAKPPTTGCVWLDSEVIADMAADPSAYYVSIATKHRPVGAGRGQLQYPA
ncbi:hypothetical protein CBR_g24413 [Chara braunii]|uniref:CHRD domain-containing protein n=1 Tax=Chara braunii TaxID=69332 RepID=A0A388JMM2_CHABU|nr:hypothetical protein CBR_g24413 [Chara braunii]|eukprot:GBG59069.1 hypothetical protein CBR_g24413 [Chara braunii]